MAKAWILRDRRGGLLIRARGTVNGKAVSRDKTIPNADQQLAEETERELNRRFILGDLSWLIEERSSTRRTRLRLRP